MDLKKIKEIVDLMNREGLIEIEIEEEGMRIKLRKREEHSFKETISNSIISTSPTEVVKTEVEKDITYIKAPMVGTFYRASSSDAPPFVDVGDTIEVGQTVCIIEAMKLMNEIKSDFKGKVIEILVDNGVPVDYGQMLFKIRLIS